MSSYHAEVIQPALDAVQESLQVAYQHGFDTGMDAGADTDAYDRGYKDGRNGEIKAAVERENALRKKFDTAANAYQIETNRLRKDRDSQRLLITELRETVANLQSLNRGHRADVKLMTYQLDGHANTIVKLIRQLGGPHADDRVVPDLVDTISSLKVDVRRAWQENAILRKEKAELIRINRDLLNRGPVVLDPAKLVEPCFCARCNQHRADMASKCPRPGHSDCTCRFCEKVEKP